MSGNLTRNFLSEELFSYVVIDSALYIKHFKMESLFFHCHIESSLQQVGYTHNDHSIKQKFRLN